MSFLEHQNEDASPRRISRREFLSASTVLAGAVILPGCVGPRTRSANERLNLGVIGVGGKGARNLSSVASENIVALCDIDAQPLSRAAAIHPAARRYADFRQLLEQPDLDAVVISTPDHTHAVAAMAAMKRGLHVYCEKPLTHSIQEARALTEAARRHRVATQMGNQGHASEGIRRLVEWVQIGIIGPVREVHCWSNRPIWPQGIRRPSGRPAIPAHVDWDLWLGPAPARPYHPDYHPFKWRGWWDFGTGALGDMGCHIMDGPYWALQLGHPLKVSATSAPVNDESAPEWSVVRYGFPQRGKLPPVQLTWHDGGKLPAPEIPGLAGEVRLPKNGSLLIGERGAILHEHGKLPQLLGSPELRDLPLPDPFLPRSPGHYREWIEACKGGPATACHFDYAGPLTETVLLGNVALRVGRPLEWQDAKMQAINAPEAAAYIRREYRRGWKL